jgi:hypothetical protein
MGIAGAARGKLAKAVGPSGEPSLGGWALSPRGRLTAGRAAASLAHPRQRRAKGHGRRQKLARGCDTRLARCSTRACKHETRKKWRKAQAAQTSPEGHRCWLSRGRRGHRPVGAHRPLASGNDVSQVPRYALWRLRDVQQVTWRTSPTSRFWCRYSARAKWSPPFRVFDAVSAGTVEMGNTASNYYIGKDLSFAFGTAVPFGNTTAQMGMVAQRGQKPSVTSKA